MHKITLSSSMVTFFAFAKFYLFNAVDYNIRVVLGGQQTSFELLNKLFFTATCDERGNKLFVF